MSKKVFVIHGIGIRGVQRYDKLVAQMQAGVGPEYELIPVYWGDVGASSEHMDKLIGQHASRSGSWQDWWADTRQYINQVTGDYTQTWWKKQQGDRSGARDLYKEGKRRRGPIKDRLRGFRHDQFRQIRMRLTQWVVPYAADVIVYQSAERRRKIQARVREVIAEKGGRGAGTESNPIAVIAHSLGGVIAFDLAVTPRNPLHYDKLITLGSQPAFFHVMDPREGLAPYEGEPVTLPKTFRGRASGWQNIWDDYDVVAFGVGEIFRLPDGTPPNDQHIRCYRNRLQAAGLMQAHLGYWDKPEAHKAIRRGLKA